MSQETERFESGSPLNFAMLGVDKLSSEQKRANNSLASPIFSEYGASIDTETAGIVEQLNSAKNEMALVQAVKSLDLPDVDDYSTLFQEDCDSFYDFDEYDFSTVIHTLDRKIIDGLCDREKDASDTTSKHNRSDVYVPNLVSDEGTVYMAKTISSTGKVRIAWDLCDENEVVVVDEYEPWASILGWEKLKQFPHGKKQIQEQYGDVLSDEVMELLVGQSAGDTETKNGNDDDGSRGRRTRTKPSDEVLNIGMSRKHKNRSKIVSEDIYDSFEKGETLNLSRYKSVDMLVLFPTTSDKLLSEHWWVAGGKPFGDGGVAIANCNKGTFEYLNQCDQVWHIEDYLSQAGDYEFETSAGPITMNTAATNNLVIHMLTEETKGYFTRKHVFDNMTKAIHDYAMTELHSSPELPHESDMVYAPITKTDAFWLRPVIRQQFKDTDGDALIVSGGSNVRDVREHCSMSSDYKLYARARLNEWDFSATELENLDDATSLYIDLDDGGMELVETLAKLHDSGKQLFSQTPESRWS